MNKYDNYKSSGIKWLDDIPEHWEVKKLKYVAKINPESLSESESENNDLWIEYIDISSVDNNGNINNTTEYLYTNAPSRARRIVREGDTILSTVRTYLKAIAFIESSSDNLICSTGFAVIRPSDRFLSKFLFYVFRSQITIDIIMALSKGVSYPAINSEEVKNINIWIPSKTEQTAIANYLDEKTARIDTLIDKKKKLIELLKEERTSIINRAVTRGINTDVKLKPSGIEWIGDIPEHWEVKKLKYVAHLESGESITSDNISKLDEYAVYGGNGLRGYTSNYTHVGEYILIGRQGALCGNINYATGKFFASEHAVVVSRYNNENILWLGELLRLMNLNQYSISAAQPGLAVERIKILNIPYPPFDEQNEIGSYIENEMVRIDNTVTNIEKEMELLIEYRTVIINDVVTGKIDVLNTL